MPEVDGFKGTEMIRELEASGVIEKTPIIALTAHAMKGDKEKCYGVVKAGKNDCANKAGTHSCAGQAATDGDTGEWIYLPTGVCERLVNGSTN